MALGEDLAGPGVATEAKAAFAHAVKRLRIQAEKRALRRARPVEGVGIDDVYQGLMIPRRFGFSKAEMMHRELALERDSVYPLEPTRQRILELRRAGARLIFISDMYLSASFLRELLREHGFWEDQDRIYVSGEIGLSKRSGNLFAHVLAAEAISAGELLHCGDDPIADVARPAAMGIQVQHFAAGRINRRERLFISRRPLFDSALSVVAGLCRKTRLITLSPTSEAEGPTSSVISGTIAPFLVAYVAWVLLNAKRLNFERLYFVARDGEILLTIARILAKRFGGPELRYLYGSRKAWLLPSICFNDPNWRDLVVTPGQGNSILDIFGRLEMDEVQTEMILSAYGQTPVAGGLPLTWRAARHFLGVMLENPISRRLLEAKVEEKRSLARRYFEQEGLRDGVSWALVDTGWGLNCQAALRRALGQSAAVDENDPFGFYIGLAKTHLSEKVAGRSFAMMPAAGSIFSRRRVIVENLFTPSTQATTVGYRYDGRRWAPVFGTETRGVEQLSYARTLKESVAIYAELAVENDRLWGAFETFRRTATIAAANFIQNPSADEARAFSSQQSIADLRHEEAFHKPLCRALDVRDVAAIVRTAVTGERRPDNTAPDWLEASCAISPPVVRAVVRTMLGIDRVINLARG
ncbi:hypothetical protein [uncultured Thiodictyon sp.]|uniref:hypothetical protein n=1 Tax=uncultured Thiodictyon sp. TaxID=1846217 RepID=UPI0025EAE555|nr:hypothetical protein [uncultured Thiodictyon sp.]